MKKELLFGIYQTPNGPVLERNMDKQLLLRALAAYLEDLRLDIACELMTKAQPNSIVR